VLAHAGAVPLLALLGPAPQPGDRVNAAGLRPGEGGGGEGGREQADGEPAVSGENRRPGCRLPRGRRWLGPRGAEHAPPYLCALPGAVGDLAGADRRDLRRAGGTRPGRDLAGPGVVAVDGDRGAVIGVGEPRFVPSLRPLGDLADGAQMAAAGPAGRRPGHADHAAAGAVAGGGRRGLPQTPPGPYG